MISFKITRIIKHVMSVFFALRRRQLNVKVILERENRRFLVTNKIKRNVNPPVV